MSDYAMQAEGEIWDGIAANAPTVEPVPRDWRFVWTSARCLEPGDVYRSGGKLRTVLGVLEQGVNGDPFALLEVRDEDGNVRKTKVFGWYDVLVGGVA